MGTLVGESKKGPNIKYPSWIAPYLNFSFELIGAVFDSCPGPISTIPYYHPKVRCPWLNIGSKILPSKFFQHDMPLFFPFLMLPATYGYFQFTEAKMSIPTSIKDGFSILPRSFMNYFKHDRAYNWAGPYLRYKERENWPLLFLYSKTDSLMPYVYVQHLIEVKREQNSSRKISAKLFEKSAHVAHMRKYPDEYKEEIKKFLEKCWYNPLKYRK